MNVTKSKCGILAALLLIAGCLITCQFCEAPAERVENAQHTVILNAWRNEKQQLIADYETRLQKLAESQDSLAAQVQQEKKLLKTSRSSARLLEARLQSMLSDTTLSTVASDSVRPLVDALVQNNEASNTLCDATISKLEAQIASKDSSLVFQSQINVALKSLQQAQDLKIHLLSQELDRRSVAERRTIRRHKFVSGCLLVLSGVTSSLLLSQSLRR